MSAWSPFSPDRRQTLMIVRLIRRFFVSHGGMETQRGINLLRVIALRQNAEHISSLRCASIPAWIFSSVITRSKLIEKSHTMRCGSSFSRRVNGRASGKFQLAVAYTPNSKLALCITAGHGMIVLPSAFEKSIIQSCIDPLPFHDPGESHHGMQSRIEQKEMHLYLFL